MNANTTDSGETRIEGAAKPAAGTILLLAASELQSSLNKCVKKGFCVRATDDLKSASALFKSEEPVLIICGLDGEGWKLIPLLRTARHNDVPILAVARDRGTLESIPVIKWALDRARQDLLGSLALDLIANPCLVPDDPKRCPPPPPSKEELEKESETTRQQLIRASSERLASTAPRNLDSRHPLPALTTPEAPVIRKSSPPPPRNDLLPEQWQAQLEERILEIEASIQSFLQQSWRDSAEHLERQSEAILALRKRIDLVAVHAETISEEISEVVKTVAEIRTEKTSEQQRITDAIGSLTEQKATDVLMQMDDLREDFNALSAVFHDITGAVEEENENNQAKLKEMLDLVKADVELASVAMQEQVERAVEMSDWVSSRTESVEKLLAEFRASNEKNETLQQTRLQQMGERFSALEKVVQGLASNPTAAITKHHGKTVDMDAFNARFDAIEASIRSLQSSASAEQGHKLVLAQLEDLRLVQTELIDRIEDLERGPVSGLTLADAEQRSELSKRVRAEITMQLNTLRQGQSLLTKRLSKVESRPPEPVTRSDPPPAPAIEEAMRKRLRESAQEIARLTEITKAVEAKLVAMDIAFQESERRHQFDSERYNTAIKASAGQLTEMDKRFIALESVLRRVDPKADGEVAWHLSALKTTVDDIAERLAALENTPRSSSEPSSSPAPPPSDAPPPAPGKPTRRGRMDSRTMQMPYTVTPVSGPPAPTSPDSSSAPPKHSSPDGIPPQSGKTLEKVRESLAKFQEEYLNRTNDKN